MLPPSRNRILEVRKLFNEIREGGDEGVAKAWLIWAHLHMESLNAPDKSEVATRLTPLVMVFIAETHAHPDTISRHLVNSVVRFLFQAKLDGREDLNMEDAKKAVQYVTEQCST